MAKIPLSQGLFAIVDDEDFDRANKHKWAALKNEWTTYVAWKVNGSTIYLHRFIMGLVHGDKRQVDHIDRNGLNCSRKNLRICSQSENQRNTARHRDGSSRFKGVSYDKPRNKWKAQICLDYKNRLIGRFKTEEEAARAYDRAAAIAFGPFARLNFPINKEGTVSGPLS